MRGVRVVSGRPARRRLPWPRCELNVAWMTAVAREIGLVLES